MIRMAVLLAASTLASCSNITSNKNEPDNQKIIYKNWVLSRCLSYTLQDSSQKQDALNTASAYLEQSSLSVEQLLDSEPLIQTFLSRNYQGSIKGTFNTQKCIDLFNSEELDELYRNLEK
jgi:hypothetical protein